ncbi:Serine/threonine-protein kinase PknB [Planctomycetes bacterium Poly30]|uniref:Serine/threonine-protein kinase PknB n=1 Tax=Saltatorellus ferox TaxID=2528018 RepID=A0A518EVD6_9BACT|nr:Serine/threonine-protein kinase PknB [Planctomycetes bacterium Poly30]
MPAFDEEPVSSRDGELAGDPLDGIADDIAADVSDFVADYLDDEDAGAVRPLSAYIARYPRAEKAVALEYLRLQGAVETAESKAPGGHSSDGAGRESAGTDVFAGRYRLLRMLGSGGQGEVWLAEDVSLGRRVALKLLKGMFVTEDRRLRFRREAESIARLEHPGLAQVHDAEVDGPQPFIAMRFVQGVDLATSLAHRTRAEAGAPVRIEPTLPWVPRNRDELFSVLRFFERTARALHAAHQAGVLHRDVKPANLMITPDGQPVLLDFGLARETSHELPDGTPAAESHSSTSALTREGDLFGTLSYMSPEQLRGESADLDGRADVWALGVTLYEALVGERPFSGATPLQLAESIEIGKLEDPRQKNGALTTDVSVVVGTALERSRERRYASALHFAEDLRRILEYEPIHARPAGPLLRFGRWCRREPAWAAALSVTLVALVAGLVASQLALAEQRRLNDKNRAAARASAVALLQQYTPAGALALGLDAVELDDTWLNRSTLYGPLLAMTLIGECEMPMARVWDAHFLSETHLIAGSVGGTVAIFEVRSGDLVASVRLPADVHSLAVGADSRHAYAGLGSGEVVGLSLPPLGANSRVNSSVNSRVDPGASPGAIVVDWSVRVADGAVEDLVSGDGSIYCIAAPGSVLALDARSGQETARYTTDGDELARLELTHGADRLVVGDTVFKRGKKPGRSHFVRILDAHDLSVVAVLDEGEQVVDFDVAGAADVVATLGLSGNSSLYDARSGASLPTVAPLGLRHERLAGARIAVSANGRRLAVGFDIGEPGADDPYEVTPSTLWLYDLDAQRPDGLATWSPGSVQERVLGIQFSPTGDRLAVADASNHVRVFCASDGTGERVHSELTRMTDLRFSPGGSTLASFGIAKLVYLWRTRRSEEAFRVDPIVPGQPEPLVWGAFAGDGEQVVVLEATGRGGVFAAPRPLRRGQRGDGEDEGTDAAGSDPAGPEPGTLLYRLDGGNAEDSGPIDVGADAERARLALSASGTMALWFHSVDGRARLTDLRDGVCVGETVVEGWEPGPIRSLDVVDLGLDGKAGATALLVDTSGVAWVWDLARGPGRLRESRTHGGWRHARMQPGPDLRLLLAAGLEEIVALAPVRAATATGPDWDEQVYEAPDLSPTAPRGIQTWVLSPDGGELVLASTIGRIYRWDTATGTLLATPSLRAPTRWLSYLDRDRVAVASSGPRTHQILGGPSSVIPMAHHSAPIRSMMAAREAGVAISGSESGAVLVWDAASGAPLVRSQLHQGPVLAVAAHGNRATLRVLSCAADGAVVLPLDVIGVARRIAPRRLSLNDESFIETILGGG